MLVMVAILIGLELFQMQPIKPTGLLMVCEVGAIHCCSNHHKQLSLKKQSNRCIRCGGFAQAIGVKYMNYVWT